MISLCNTTITHLREVCFSRKSRLHMFSVSTFWNRVRGRKENKLKWREEKDKDRKEGSVCTRASIKSWRGWHSKLEECSGDTSLMFGHILQSPQNKEFNSSTVPSHTPGFIWHPQCQKESKGPIPKDSAYSSHCNIQRDSSVRSEGRSCCSCWGISLFGDWLSSTKSLWIKGEVTH